LELLTYLGLDVLVARIEVTEMPLEGVDLLKREIPLTERINAFVRGRFARRRRFAIRRVS
jgi:hypothetical protein